MQSVSVIAALLLTLGCFTGAYAFDRSTQYESDMTSSDSVQMDGLTQLTENEPDVNLGDNSVEHEDNEDSDDRE